MSDAGLRIRGDETGADADCHRARYKFAASILIRGSSVLDYGCGTGYGTVILNDAGLDATGYDPLVSPYDKAHGDSYDAVVCFEVLEHLNDPPLATLTTLEKLAPIVIVSVPYKEKPKRNRHHVWSGLHEGNFPGRAFYYQSPTGVISTDSVNAQNLIIVSRG